MLVFEAELVTNYTSVVILVKFLLPHLLSMNVRAGLIHCFFVLTSATEERKTDFSHTYQLLARHISGTMGAILCGFQGGHA